MNTFNLATAPALRAATTVGSALAAVARGLGNLAFHALKPRRESDNVWTLDDRMLDDIGLTRGDVLRPDFHGRKRR